MSDTWAGELKKTPGDKLWLEFDLGNLKEIAAGAAIQSATIPAVADLTIEGSAVVGTHAVGAWYSGGADGTDYDVLVNVTLSDGSKIAPTGTLRVRSK